MPFAKTFRKQSWFVRLPLGEIELLEGSSVERAFSLGTLGAQTPVCPVGSQAWTSLATAADLDDALSLVNLTPGAGDVVAAAVPDGAWRFRSNDLPILKSRRSPIIAVLSGAAAAVVLLGAHLSSALVHQAAAAPAHVAVTPTSAPVVADDPPAPSPKAVERLDPGQKKQLRVVDQIQKQYAKDRSSRRSRTSLAPPR